MLPHAIPSHYQDFQALQVPFNQKKDAIYFDTCTGIHLLYSVELLLAFPFVSRGALDGGNFSVSPALQGTGKGE